ncbi:MAG: hypothetical protein WA782_19655 [Sulfitobacter sp.]
MKPSFALSLSVQGIRLLHRAAGGWRIVGDVELDAEDMAAELAVLRKTASDLEPGALHSKILLPNEQIKYLTIDTPGFDPSARRAAAALALDGATPYAVDELVFDCSLDGDRTHIAAVAKETLVEAESFARDHRFQPVSFAAIPGDQPFVGEPFFGLTSDAATLLDADETVTPDSTAVKISGKISVPSGPVAAAKQDVEPDLPPARPAVVETAKPAAKPETDAAVTTPKVDRSPNSPSVVPDPPAAESRTQKPVLAAPEKAAPPQKPAPPEKPALPSIGFASRRAPEAAATPKLDGVHRDGISAPEGTITAGHIDIEPDVVPPVVDQPADVLTPPAAETKTGFLSRRSPKARDAKTTARPKRSDTQEPSESERLTIFGARKSQVRGKPRFLGLILTAALLVLLAGVAAWASVFLDNGLGLSRLFGDRSEPQIVTAPAVVEEPPADTDTGVQLAALDTGLSEEDAAVLDALREQVEPVAPVPPTEAEIETRYATTGIWPIAPQVPPEPAGLINIEDLYLTSIDPVSTTTDAVALPDVESFGTDIVLAALASPAAAGTAFTLDDRGLVVPAAAGALSPDGYTVFLGRPPLVPPATPTRFQSAPEDTEVRSVLGAARPKPRPTDLAENNERAQLDGLTRSELADYRPALRPASLQQKAEAQAALDAVPADQPMVNDGAVALALATPNPIENATRLAVRASVRPDVRPRNFSRIVKRAERAKPKDEVRVASAASVAPRSVTPKIPSSASVAKQATVKNALNLRSVNLIGVYGKPSSRRALVRLSNGRYQKVVVGDKIDGGRVSAIGESELRYKKRGRDLILKMPR